MNYYFFAVSTNNQEWAVKENIDTWKLFIKYNPYYDVYVTIPNKL
jgi:hypothetical protein